MAYFKIFTLLFLIWNGFYPTCRDKEIVNLVNQLGDESWSKREEANVKLLKMKNLPIGYLYDKAINSEDCEVKRRCQSIYELKIQEPFDIIEIQSIMLGNYENILLNHCPSENKVYGVHRLPHYFSLYHSAYPFPNRPSFEGLRYGSCSIGFIYYRAAEDLFHSFKPLPIAEDPDQSMLSKVAAEMLIADLMKAGWSVGKCVELIYVMKTGVEEEICPE